MKSLHNLRVVLLFALLALVGCRKPADQSDVKVYDVTGKVVSVDAANSKVTLDHEDIPGLMQAMEMEFKVDNPQVLEEIVVGADVRGRLEVRSGDYIITELEKH
jgi:protein SCO1/2